jgi:hypothetical protein
MGLWAALAKWLETSAAPAGSQAAMLDRVWPPAIDDVGRRQQRTEWGAEDRWRRLRSGSRAETDVGSRPGPPATMI